MKYSKNVLRTDIGHYRGLLQIDNCPNMSSQTREIVQNMLADAERKLSEVEAEEDVDVRQAG